MSKFIMALDAGTTSNRCILFNEAGEICSMAQKEFRQMFPNPGWVEHDANEIWSTQLGVAVEAMSKIGATAADIAAIGITNQRETAIVWNKETGEPVYNAIVWQCRRTADIADALKKKGLEDSYRKKTGLIIDAYFSATKIKWILDNVKGARKLAEEGKLLFGTVETWLIWKLTKGEAHVTDYSNASRTMLFNINTLTWDKDILAELDIPESMLPKPMPSSCVYGYTDPAYFGSAIPIAGAAGDQQAALFGQTCFSEGEAKNTYGTGCFLLMNTGTDPVMSGNGLLTTIAASTDPAKVELGFALYHDTRLSADNTISCATCHGLNTGGVDRKQYSEGINGQFGGVNAPTVYNAALNFVQFWDGRAADLKEQAAGPPLNPVEMGCTSFDQICEALAQDKDFTKKFTEVYPEGYSQSTITDAIAEFEKTLLTPSRFDKYLMGDKNALTAEELEGYQLFKDNKCATCHVGVNVGGQSYEFMGIKNSYFDYRNTGLTDGDNGRYAVTKKESDRHKFKTPTLRNVMLTYPYMHDGTVASVEDAIRIMHEFQIGKEINDVEVEKIVVFLGTLNGEYNGKMLQ